MRFPELRALIPHRRVALGLSDNAAPSLVFVFAGILLGPEGLNIISATALAYFSPAISVALAVLGVFIGSELAAVRSTGALGWVGGAVTQGFITLCVVGVSMFVLLSQWGLSLPLDPLNAAVILGLCCAVSAAVKVSVTGDATTAAAVADFDDVLPVVLGGLIIALLSNSSSPATALALTAAAGVIIAVAGAVLFEFADGAPERGVFVTGTVLLLGGAAAYVGASPLLSGCIAGVIWTGATESMANLVDSDLRKLQHPLVAILVILAGASSQFSYPLLWIAAPLVLARLTGKLVGSMVTARLVDIPAGLLATVLTPPGVLGIAFALNVQQVISTGDSLIVSAVAAATVGSELLATVLVGSLHTRPLPAGERA